MKLKPVIVDHVGTNNSLNQRKTPRSWCADGMPSPVRLCRQVGLSGEGINVRDYPRTLPTKVEVCRCNSSSSF